MSDKTNNIKQENTEISPENAKALSGAIRDNAQLQEVNLDAPEAIAEILRSNSKLKPLNLDRVLDKRNTSKNSQNER